MYAIFETGGKQVQASPGAQVQVERIDGEIGSTVEFDRVLLVNRDGKLDLGRPYLEGAKITARVVEQGRESKTLVFRKKRRKQYRRTRGHRQPYTAVRIEKIKA